MQSLPHEILSEETPFIMMGMSLKQAAGTQAAPRWTQLLQGGGLCVLGGHQTLASLQLASAGLVSFGTWSSGSFLEPVGNKPGRDLPFQSRQVCSFLMNACCPRCL